MGHLLIVATTQELRASLQFALEADGHTVRVTSKLDAAADDPVKYDCTVLDHHAADKRSREAIRAFYEAHRPVVLLANVANHPLVALSHSTVLKPLLGPALSRAVADAIDASA